MKTKQGFTLVEIMVAVSIFVVVAMIAMGAFITANFVNKQAQAIKLVMDNLNFAMDSMVLKMRQGGGFHCLSSSSFDTGTNVNWYSEYEQSSSCSGSEGDAIAFTTPGLGAEPKHVIYVVKENILYMWQEDFGPRLVPVTSGENMRINHLQFDVDASSAPQVQIIIDGVAEVAGRRTNFAIQTTVAERV